MSHRCFLGRIPRLFLLLSSGPIWAGPVLTLSGLPRVPRAEQRDFGSCVQQPPLPSSPPAAAGSPRPCTPVSHLFWSGPCREHCRPQVK